MAMPFRNNCKGVTGFHFRHSGNGIIGQSFPPPPEMKCGNIQLSIKTSFSLTYQQEAKMKNVSIKEIKKIKSHIQ